MSRKGFRGSGGGMGSGGINPGDLMRQMRKVQEDMERIQTETAQETVTVTAGGGVIAVTINGALEIQSITIKPEVVDPDDVEMLQDLILGAMNEAIQKGQALMSDRMAALTGGLGIPGL